MFLTLNAYGDYMKKLLPILVLLFALSVFADIEMLQPFYSKIENNQTIEIGAMQPGETLELVFYKKTFNFVFDSIWLDESLLPPNWDYSVDDYDQTFNVTLYVPFDEVERIQKLNFIVSAKGITQRFSLILKIKKNLLETTIDKTSDEITLGESSKYKISIINNSIASHSIRIYNDLPSLWADTIDISLRPQEKKVVELIVFPSVYGNKSFHFEIYSVENRTIIDTFNINLNVKPSLKGKFFAVFSGFPFFSLSLMPYMLFDGFLALLG